MLSLTRGIFSTPSRFLPKTKLVCFLIVFAFPAPSPASGGGNNKIADLAATQTDSYVTMPLQVLMTRVTALAGLKPDSSDADLSRILSRTGSVVDTLLPKLPDLIASEVVKSSYFKPVTTGRHHDQTMLVYRSSARASFSYLLLHETRVDGSIAVKEYRMDNGNREVDLSDAVNSAGFANTWLFFASSNQSESEFRYLGQQEMEGVTTLVVAFAQIPDRVKISGILAYNGQEFPFHTQGVAWINSSNFRIVALQSDLLAPLPEAHLKRMTSYITFHSVRVAGVPDELWLPDEVHISSEQTEQVLKERHQYKNYRLYRAKSRVVLP